MNARMIFTVLAVLASPYAAAAQATSEASASATLEATVRAGLPEAPVRRTMEEGHARGASEEQVARAALATHARLGAAREALRDEERPEPTSAEIVAGADALLAGARPGDLERVREGAPAQRSLVASLTVLAEITSRGEGSGRAAAAIATRLAAGASDRDIAALAAGGGVGSSLPLGVASGAAEGGLRFGGGLDLLGATTTVGASVMARPGIGGL